MIGFDAEAPVGLRDRNAAVVEADEHLAEAVGNSRSEAQHETSVPASVSTVCHGSAPKLPK